MAGTAEECANMLLVTANVGSLFEDPDNLWKIWMKEFFKTVEEHKPHFLALHCQELGGKSIDTSVKDVKRFVKELMDHDGLRDYGRARIYIDESYEKPECFTALGSFYFIHDSVKSVFEFDFEVGRHKKVVGREIYTEKLHKSPLVQKEKFPSDFFAQCKWTRKGFMRTRWGFCSRDFDLINVHLFHDAHNIVAWEESPSYYAGLRKKALNFVLERITHGPYEKLPFFLFGDFNFRLDARPLFEHLCPTGTIETIANPQDEMHKLIFRERENDRKVLLEVERKIFNYANPTIFEHGDCLRLLKFDKEMLVFAEQLDEMEITFPPTYPYMEDLEQAKQYNPTRCPAWCDRILMSPSAQSLIAKRGDENDDEDVQCGDSTTVYDNIGPNVCMGDHKPVFLSFRLPTSKGNLYAFNYRCCVVE